MPDRTLPLIRILGEVKKSINNLVEAISEYQQSQSEQDNRDKQAESKAVVRLPVEITEHYASENSDRPVKSKRERIRLLLEIVGVLIAFAIAGMTLRSLHIFNQQLQELRNQTEISERPWLSVDFEVTNSFRFVNGEAALSASVGIKNVGKSVAKNIQIQALLIPTKELLPLDASQRQRNLCDKPRLDQIGGVDMGFDLFPNNSPEVVPIGVDAKQSDIESQSIKIKLPDGTTHVFVEFYVIGCVIYRSSFSSNLHETRFAYHITTPPIVGPNHELLSTNPMSVNLFEVGVDVPAGKFGKIIQPLAANDAL